MTTLWRHYDVMMMTRSVYQPTQWTVNWSSQHTI